MILSLSLLGAAQAGPIQVVDDLGRTIQLESPASKVIALYGAYNEILAAMGLEDRLVARTKADVLPPSILSKPCIGTHMRPNVELVLGLKPDLVIQQAGRHEASMAVEQLWRRGLQVAVFHPTTFLELFSVIQRIGILVGEEEAARKLVASMQSRLEAVQRRIRGVRSRQSVFFEVRYPNLLGAGRGSIVNEIIHCAGGINCLRLRKKFVRTDMEALIACNPDVYVVQRGPMNPNPGKLSTRPHFQILKAVQKDRVLMVDEQIYSRPGPRSVEAVEQLARFLHPSLFLPEGSTELQGFSRP